MKVLQEKYPMGSFRNQKSAGRYVDGYLYKNLETMAKAISRDMTFMGVCFSSTLEVGTGKSVFCTQMGEIWTDIINRMYNLDLKFTSDNVVWRPKELIEHSFKLPKYSFILLDEWEDKTYWSEMGITLRQFFRKCRQLNLFIMVIIPNWFQMPLGYAISRSAFAIDVKFVNGFERGNYDFYSFQSKRKLYIKGKKFHNYNVAQADFSGAFTDGYGIPEEEYRKAKLEDMKKWEADDEKTLSPKDIERELKLKMMRDNPNFTQKDWAEIFGITPRAIRLWKAKNVGEKTPYMGDVPEVGELGNNLKEINNKKKDIKEEPIVEGEEQ